MQACTPSFLSFFPASLNVRSGVAAGVTLTHMLVCFLSDFFLQTTESGTDRNMEHYQITLVHVDVVWFWGMCKKRPVPVPWCHVLLDCCFKLSSKAKELSGALVLSPVLLLYPIISCQTLFTRIRLIHKLLTSVIELMTSVVHQYEYFIHSFIYSFSQLY